MTTALRQRLGDPRRTERPWHALWAMMVGFFMILLDATIVSVANPEILEHLDTDYDGVLWVTSAYLLAYAVPLLLAGRLGDRYGPKNLYLAGLALFTAASLWCGLAGSIEWLIAARVVQGIGAALMTPQTLSTITRIFPPERRGVALSVWGATAGVATLVGPLAGGFLVDGLGWQWIFIVNVPIGIIGLALAFWFVPALSTERHALDVLGVLLSGAGLFLIVFGLQEGESHDWAWWIWVMVAVGLALMAGFVYWQSVNRGEPLIPLKIFRDKDFSMSNLGIAVIGFAVTAMIVPVMFYAQAVRGWSPTGAALLVAPMAVASGVLAPFVGKIVDRAHPRPIVGFGFSALAIALTWLSVELRATTPTWRLVLPLTVVGVGMAFVWSPLAATATRNLPSQLAGAGSGVYNTMRQVGGVLGSAGIAAFMTSRMSAMLPGVPMGADATEGTVTELPGFLKDPFTAALSQSLLLPAFVALFGVVAALFLRGFGDGVMLRPAPRAGTGSSRKRSSAVDEGPDELDAFTAALRTRDGADRFVAAGGRELGRVRPTDPRVATLSPASGGAEVDYFPDDDDYVEFTVDWDDDTQAEDAEPTTEVIPAIEAFPSDDSATAPLFARIEHPLPAPADTWHSGPVESWHSLLEAEPEPQPNTVAPTPQVAASNGHDWWGSAFDDVLAASSAPTPEPSGFGRNGFHGDAEPAPPPDGGRHSRRVDDDAGTYGKHSMRFRD